MRPPALELREVLEVSRQLLLRVGEGWKHRKLVFHAEVFQQHVDVFADEVTVTTEEEGLAAILALRSTLVRVATLLVLGDHLQRPNIRPVLSKQKS